ncbi:MAG: response regulator [Pseudanabaena sp.]
MNTDNLEFYSLVEQLRVNGRKQFTGKLELHSIKGYKWSIYYCHGRLVWASGGVHNYRRWRRLMGQYKLQIDFNKISLRNAEEIRLWDYHVLVILMKRMVLSRAQISPIIESFVHEILFDIIQCAANEQITSYCDFEDEITPVIALIHAEQAIEKALEDWITWRKLGIADFSPNLSPWIKSPEKLKEEASDLTYKTLITILNGRQSLRELSTWMKKDLLTLVKSLMAYYHRGLIDLAEVSDIQAPIRAIPLTNREESTKLLGIIQERKSILARPLIACVDDSNQVCATIEQIATGLGFSFLGIKESIKVLTLLIEHKPSLIILDLVMPIVSGYELCTQIRRIPDFKDTPILILTSNDSLIDRIRSHLVGATAFISKTSGNEKIGEQIKRYLLNAKSETEEKIFIDVPSS